MGFGAFDEKECVAENRRKNEDNELHKFFRPELLNRIQRVVSFKPLDRHAIGQIVETIFARIRSRVKERGYDLVLGEGASDALLGVGFDQRYGAREMERVMERQIVDVLAKGNAEISQAR